MIEVVRPGPLATVQDLGRPGYAHLGVPHSGAADTASLRLANRLVGNDEGAAAIELTFGGAALRFLDPAWIALTGAPVSGATMNSPCRVQPGTLLSLGTPSAGVRTYLAVRGGIQIPFVLGSRSTDLLSSLGPAPLQTGTTLPIGPTSDLPPITVDTAPTRPFTNVLSILPGPRDAWFPPEALDVLCGTPYEVTPESNRIGVRLRGPKLPRANGGELPSEGVVTGALQVPPDGMPILFLPDHPTTGGYPVIAVLKSTHIPQAAQLRPGTHIRFRVGPC